MAQTKRLTRDEIEQPDQVTSALEESYLWILQHPRQIVIGLSVLALALAGGIGIASWMRARDARAGVALGKVIDVASRPLGAVEAAQPGGGQPFPDAAARDNAVLQEVDAMLAEHGATRAARGARMIKAQALARRGRYADAAALYGEVAGAMPSDAPGAAAALGLAQARAALGETDAAAEDLKRIAGARNPYLPRDLALKSAAEIRERAGQTDAARKLYEELVQEVPDSPFLGEARSRIQELTARPDAAGQ